MTATEVYDHLLYNIQATIEIFTSVGDERDALSIMAWEKVPPNIAYKRNVQGHRMIFEGDINRLSLFLKEYCSIDAPRSNTLPQMIDYLLYFQANKEIIVKAFESVIGHPEKRIQHGLDDFTTYEDLLLSRMKVINERAMYIQEQFEKLILVIDSESQ